MKCYGTLEVQGVCVLGLGVEGLQLGQGSCLDIWHPGVLGGGGWRLDLGVIGPRR